MEDVKAPESCPKCGSDRVEMDDDSPNWGDSDNSAELRIGVNCLICKARWTEFYTFKSWKMEG